MHKILNLPTRRTPVVNSSKDFIFERCVGQGSFGKVYRARIKGKEEVFGVKMVRVIR